MFCCLLSNYWESLIYTFAGSAFWEIAGETTLLDAFSLMVSGNNPKQHLVHATYRGELASLNGRKVRNPIASEDYTEVFCNVSIAEDFKVAEGWVTNHGG